MREPINYSIVVLLHVCFSNAMYADIHKCVSTEGIEYSDTHCNVGVLVKHIPGYQTIGTMEGLSGRELEILGKLEKAYRKARIESEQRRYAHRKQSLRIRTRERLDRARVCANAIQGLERLRSIKRKGYSAKQSHSLDVRQNLLDNQKRLNC